MTGSSLMESLFQQSLEDMIKGLRQQLIGEQQFISKAMDEIHRELKSTDLSTKSTALLKLSHLSSLYFHDMSFAAFNALEVLSSPRFAHKKVAYHAISLSFNESTSVILLITNHLRKDLSSTNEYEVSLSLQCLSRIANVDLARDLTPEVFTLLGSSKLSVRKKAIGVVLKVFEKYPDAVRVYFKRLVENLESPDQQIVSAVVGVFCELTAKDPRSYLPLAPEFYKILVDSRNNWVLIKVLKIFAKLAPLEPRLAKRVVEPICDHMGRTGAKSFLFECIKTVVGSLTEYESAVNLAISKIQEFLVDDDPNLKYLGLQAFSAVAPKHLQAVLENKEVVIKSLSDDDPNIKTGALRLVMAMVSESNVAEICKVLVNYALKSDPKFCNEILGSILTSGCRNVYEIIVDFDWYISLLGEMSRIPNCQKGEEIESQLIDIGVRVKDARPELVHVARDLLIDPALLGNPFLHKILSASAWLSGEYVQFSRNSFELLEALLQPRTSLLPSCIRAIYIQSAFKVLAFCVHSYLVKREVTDPSSSPDNLHSEVSESVASESFEVRYAENGSGVGISHEQTSAFALQQGDNTSHESIMNMLNLAELALGPVIESYDVEIQERTRNVLGFIHLSKQGMLNPAINEDGGLESNAVEASKAIEWMADAFSEELGPVSASAQQRVPLPNGLTLSENLCDLEAICGDIEQPLPISIFFASSGYEDRVGVSLSNLQIKEEPEPSSESTSLLAEHRKRHGLYYLPSEKSDPDDYPRANEPTAQDNMNDDANVLSRLTEQSLTRRKKPNYAKPRPVVVKLDEGDGLPILTKKAECKDDSMSGAVREMLLSGEASVSSFSGSNMSERALSKSKGKEKQDLHLQAESKEIPVVKGTHTSRKSKNRSHGKERSHRTSREKNPEERDDDGKKDKSKRHGRHKQLADEPLNMAANSPVIPDFLL